VKLLIALSHRFQPWIAPQWFSQRLRNDFPQIDVMQLPNYDRITEEIADADLPSRGPCAAIRSPLRKSLAGSTPPLPPCMG